MRTKIGFVLALAMLPAALPIARPAAAQRLPAYVAGPLSGYTHDCQEAGQPAPGARGMVLSGDLDGDGQPDHVIDAGRGCAANRALYCSDEGCVVDVFLSSQAGQAASFRARHVRVAGGALELVLDGPACGKPAGEDCAERLRWNGTAFVPGPRP